MCVRIITHLLVSICCVYWSLASLAAECDLPTRDTMGDPISSFDVLHTRGCFGGSACSNDLCNLVTEWEKTEDPVQTAPASRALFSAIAQAADQLPNTEDVTKLRNRLQEWDRKLARAEVKTLPTAEWQTAKFKIFLGHPQEIKLDQSIDTACEQITDACLQVFTVSTQIATLAVLQGRVLNHLLSKNRELATQYVAQINQRWQHYFEQARAQYPWEVWINSALYEREAPKRGFVDAPNWQVIALHPSPAYQFTDAYQDQLNEALILEMVGWYSWRWGGKDKAELKKPKGGSLIVSWDGQKDVDPGVGVMLHLPRNWSVAAVHQRIAGEDEVSFLVSVDLAKWIIENQALRQTLLKF